MAGGETRGGRRKRRRRGRHRRSTVGFAAAPLLMLMFGVQAVEAISDRVRKRDSIPVFNRLGGGWAGGSLPLVGLYLVVMVALLVADRLSGTRSGRC